MNQTVFYHATSPVYFLVPIKNPPEPEKCLERILTVAVSVQRYRKPYIK